MRWLLLLALLLAAHPARAASFDCQKAATATERAICADKALSDLDERAVAAYADVSQAFGFDDADFKNPMATLFLQGHQDWTAARNRCGAATNCLLAQYLRRIAVLTGHPDPQAPSPLDRYVGRYGTIVDPARELLVIRAGTGVLVHVTVTSKDWSCDFTGIGRLDKSGGLLVTRPDFDGTAEGDHAVLLTPTRLGVALAHASKTDDVSARYCGAGGSMEQPFPRRTE
jgi:uncharacterized protein